MRPLLPESKRLYLDGFRSSSPDRKEKFYIFTLESHLKIENLLEKLVFQETLNPSRVRADKSFYNSHENILEISNNINEISIGINKYLLNFE